jgi:hypothetical protein
MSRHTIRHLVEQPGKHGPRWFWQPSSKLRALGWRPQRLLVATLAEAMERAEQLNGELDEWRARQGQPKRPPGAAAGTVAALIADYKASKWFIKLAPRTARDYGHYLDAIATWAADMPARAITPPAVQAFHDMMAVRTEGRGRNRRTIRTPARAAAAVRVLSALLAAGRRLGYVPVNAAAGAGISVQRQRDPVLWTPELLAHMVATADAMGWRSQGTAMLLNYWCGQRQADILALPPYRLEQGAIVLQQGKTRRRVSLPVHLVPELVARLEGERGRNTVLASTTHLLLHDRTTQPWLNYTFTHVFAEIREAAAAGLPAHGLPPMPACASLRWMELRHAAVTVLHAAGVDPLGIAAITGHTPGSVQSILDRHYLIRTSAAAEGAFRARLNKESGT